VTSGPENPWSDHGDPARARRLAWMWTAMSVVGWGTAGFATLSWWTAQVTGRAGEYEWRGYAEGDMFPWYLVIPFGVLGLCLAVVAARKWARARRLARGNRGS
jgi:MFS family permease